MRKIIFGLLLFCYSGVKGQQSYLEFKSENKRISSKANVSKEMKLDKIQTVNPVELKGFDTTSNFSGTNIKIAKDYFNLYKDHLILQIESATSQLDTVKKELNKSIDEVLENYTISKQSYSNELLEDLYKRDSLIEQLQIENLKTIKEMTVFKLTLDSLNTIKTKIKNNRIGNTQEKDISELLAKEFKDLDKQKEKANNILKNAKKISEKIQIGLMLTQAPLVDAIDKYKPKEETRENQIQTLPELLTPIGNGLLIPSFNILGSNEFVRGKINGNIKIFTSAAKDEKNIDYRSILIPEAGNFGIIMNAQKYFIPEKTKSNFSLTGMISYIQKNNARVDSSLTADNSLKLDTVNAKYSQFQFKAGAEYILVPGVISVYSDFNLMNSITGIDDLKGSLSFLKNDNKKGFFNTGVKFKIAPSQKLKAKQSYLIFDINFIWLNKDNRLNFARSNDKVIPVIKTGFRI